MAHDGSVGWVRAAEAARMLGVSRERVRQLLAKRVLIGRRVSGRIYRVSLASIHARLASPLHRSKGGAGQHPMSAPKGRA